MSVAATRTEKEYIRLPQNFQRTVDRNEARERERAREQERERDRERDKR
jgi:hypothetical protein